MGDGCPFLAHRDEMAMSAPTSARGGRAEEICSAWDLSPRGSSRPGPLGGYDATPNQPSGDRVPEQGG